MQKLRSICRFVLHEHPVLTLFIGLITIGARGTALIFLALWILESEE